MVKYTCNCSWVVTYFYTHINEAHLHDLIPTLATFNSNVDFKFITIKLSREKTFAFTHNGGKTFVVLLNKNKSSLHVLKIRRENFHGLLKIHENHKSLLP